MLMLQNIKDRWPSLLWNISIWKLIATLKSITMGPYAQGGAIQRTSTYLIMSHDSNEMTSTLKDGRLHLRAPAEGVSEHFTRLKAILGKVLDRSGATMRFSYFYGRAQSPPSGD